MNDLNKLETLVASWYKGLPHLSKPSQKWLADNVWWLALVGVIIGGIIVSVILGAVLLTGVALIATVGNTYGAVLGGAALVTVLAFLAIAIASLVLTGLAVTPLKEGRKKGWTLLFIVALLNVAAQIITFLPSFNLFGLIWGLFMVAIGGYLLFEIRGYFVKGTPVKPTLKKAA